MDNGIAPSKLVHLTNQYFRLLDKFMNHVDTKEIKAIMPVSAMELQDVKNALTTAMKSEPHRRPVVLLASSNEQQAIYVRPSPHVI